MDIFGKCNICGKEGEKFSAHAYLCLKHAESWRKRHHKVFPFWKTEPKRLNNDDWEREFNRWANEQVREQVEFT